MIYRFTLTGITPLITNADNVENQEAITAWRKDPANKANFVRGDDRSPSWSWQAYIYDDGERIVIPTEMIVAALCKAATQIKLQGDTTLSGVARLSIHAVTEFCDLQCGGKTITLDDINALKDLSFVEQVAAVRRLGFDLLAKRATIGTTDIKLVRVRPRFHDWTVTGTIYVDGEEITPEVFQRMATIAGQIAGIGDWRPGSAKKPGPHGMFRAQTEVLETAPEAVS